ncbi:uncharacterized protein KY384_005975 [Bacidia gigantensis]|uniref:uncharacterized protein n=1 Tax=Bacidia gigantensis TaxID=2732470 RepID=UPI001D05777C|nr:uncharacterized protein KY384_005975 [Bacidia gigantensis]KAG8529339.1 hypothetical protein KY384_005975 [Bacidia gigantensis]
MDYSLLVGIHDLKKGNEENLRDKTLRVFQPGGEDDAEQQAKILMRTPSKLENVKQAKQLREIIKKERPVPIEKSSNKMPEEMLDERKHSVFYSDDGGFGATHEEGQPGEEIYYLGIIDCLTHYGFIKRVEHLWKGMSNNKSQISPIPPEDYGDRFVKFMSGLTMTKEESERISQAGNHVDGSGMVSNRKPSWSISRKSTDKVIERAEKQAYKSEKESASEDPSKDLTLSAVRHPSPDRSGGGGGAILPVVEEDAEGASREASIRREKTRSPNPPNYEPPTPAATSKADSGPAQLPSIPHLNRLSIGIGSG